MPKAKSNGEQPTMNSFSSRTANAAKVIVIVVFATLLIWPVAASAESKEVALKVLMSGG